MSRFTPDRSTFFDEVYRGIAPWDVGKAQPALAELLDEFPPREPVLDVGCGTGDLAIEIATRGLQVVGVDLAIGAIEQAQAKLETESRTIVEKIEFRVADALRPSQLGMSFGAVVDSGFFHVFDTEQRDVFVEELATTLRPGGSFYLLAFATEFPVPNTPLEVTEAELRARFTEEKGWRVLAMRPAEFQSTFAPVPAIAACFER